MITKEQAITARHFEHTTRNPGRKPIMKITAHRAKQIEATIRRLRNHPDLWGDDEVKSLRITSIIIKRKIALCDYYDRTRRDFAGERLLQMYA